MTEKNRFMKYKIKYVLIIACLALACSSKNDNCKKEIIVQYETTITNPSGTIYIPEVVQEVPCDYPEPADARPISDSGMLKNFTYEVINFTFTPDTGHNTSRLQFEIKLNNLNNFKVYGTPILTSVSNGLQIKGSYSNNAFSPCNSIGANSSCTFVFDHEDSLDLGIVNSIELINVEYFVGN